jgi:transposase
MKPQTMCLYGTGSEVSRLPKKTRKVYDPKFKMRVALEALRGEKTLSEVVSENSVSPSLACE